MSLYCHDKDDEEYMYQVSTAAAEDVVQGQKGQATIETDNRYDAG
jgi:hypothetical protein